MPVACIARSTAPLRHNVPLDQPPLPRRLIITSGSSIVVVSFTYRSRLEYEFATDRFHQGQNRTRENRPSDRREACGIVVIMGDGMRPLGKLTDLPPYPTITRAPLFYPDFLIRTAAGTAARSMMLLL